MIRVTMALVSTAVGLVLLLSFRSHPVSGSASGQSALGGDQTPVGNASSAATPRQSPGKASGKGQGKTAPAGKSGTFTGKAITTDYGPMQVAAVVANGRLTDVKVLQQTNSGARSQDIDANALPKLRTAALAKQSANVDVVSGATYTSQGYAKSLQSALDQAGL